MRGDEHVTFLRLPGDSRGVFCFLAQPSRSDCGPCGCWLLRGGQTTWGSRSINSRSTALSVRQRRTEVTSASPSRRPGYLAAEYRTSHRGHVEVGAGVDEDDWLVGCHVGGDQAQAARRVLALDELGSKEGLAEDTEIELTGLGLADDNIAPRRESRVRAGGQWRGPSRRLFA